MAAYSVFLRKSVRDDIESIPKRDRKNILARIAALSTEPRSYGCEKLSDQERYRVRQGRYRIVYSIQDDELTVWVIKVGHRKDVYR